MKPTFKINALTLLTVGITTASAYAHDGRRFDVQVVDNQLVALGYISGNNPADDGNGLVRSYYNALHGHWENIGTIASRADLPGFDINGQSSLIGDELWLEMTAIKKWSNAPFADFAHSHGHGHGQHNMPKHDGRSSGTATPKFLTIPTDESIDVRFNGVSLDLGSPIRLDDNLAASAHYDLSFDYYAGDPLGVELAPADAIYLVEFELSTSDASIQSSDTIHVILSPSGMMVPGSHGLSLATEVALGTPVPEPALIGAVVFAPLLLRRRR